MPKKKPKLSPLQEKFCSLENRAFHCRESYACDIACPFNRWLRFLDLVGDDFETNTAHEQAIRESIDEDMAYKIIAEHTREKKEYPSKEDIEKFKKEE